MLPILAELTVRGTLLVGLVWLLERTMATRMQAQSRRLWWAIAALAFLLPLHVPLLAPVPVLPGRVHALLSSLAQPAARVDLAAHPSAVPSRAHRLTDLVLAVWLAGAAISLTAVVFQTVRTGLRWRRESLCTKPELLTLLEDCKAAASVTAPIGLVLSDRVPAPAILGWLRPRILLPTALATTLPRPQLRAVLLHELAHFRALDQPLHWLFTFARVIHWFNPAAHACVRQWLHFRELAADEAAMRWLTPQERPDYSRTLVEALKHAQDFPAPYGALALGETLQNLKHRLTMITRHSSLARHRFFAFAIGLLLTATVFVQPIWADPASDGKTAAATAAEPWLTIIDDGQYATSWENASLDFKKGATSEKWQEMSAKVRTPLGKCLSRKLSYSTYHAEQPTSDGKGDGWGKERVTLHYLTSFENMKAATETVYFVKDPDGAWKADAYVILHE
jgi:beta-lactamase regulating signal transducer with metallopeptidase domain